MLISTEGINVSCVAMLVNVHMTDDVAFSASAAFLSDYLFLWWGNLIHLIQFI